MLASCNERGKTMNELARGVQLVRDILLLEVYLHGLGFLPMVDGKLDANTGLCQLPPDLRAGLDICSQLP
jgi:hypothetical protein